MTDSDKKYPFVEWFKSQGPLALAFAGLVTAATGWITAQTAKVETRDVEASAQRFEETIAEARESDEETLNRIVEMCYDNDRILRYYAQRIEAGLYVNIRHALRNLETDDPVDLQYSPMEFVSPRNMSEADAASFTAKLRAIYANDELLEAVRLIELDDISTSGDGD